MKRWIMIASVIWALGTGTALAQDSAAAPTRVNETGVYVCPGHPDMAATWAARCPTCGTALNLVQPAATLIPVGDRDRERREAERREEERRERYRRYYGYYPPYGYAYPQRFSAPPAGFLYYPNFGYYYNPNTGIYYYPNTGYYYNPYTGQYFYTPPGYGSGSYPYNNYYYRP